MARRVQFRRDGNRCLDIKEAIVEACETLLFPPNPKFIAEGELRFIVMREALKGLLWHYSEQTSIPGDKFLCCPFWSVAAYQAYQERNGEKLTLEHVFPREEARDELCSVTAKSDVRRILDKLECCVILKKQNSNLPQRKDFVVTHTNEPGAWWMRYANNIKVCKGPRFEQAEGEPRARFEKRWDFLCSQGIAESNQRVGWVSAQGA